MANDNKHKTISPDFKQILLEIVSDISTLVSEYLGVTAYDEDKIREIADGAFEPDSDDTQS